jgi:tetratricopeptide (TPR) repeat protein
MGEALTPEQEQTFRDLLVKGSRLLARHKFNEALPLLERAHTLNPDSFEAVLNYGSAYILAGRFKQARPILESAIERHGNEPQLWINLGAVYLGNPILANDADQRKALDAFNKAVALDPYAPNVEYNIGLIHRDRGEKELAINAFKRALAINPGDKDARSLIEKLTAS